MTTPNMRKQIPYRVRNGLTSRQWKAKKRKELNNVLKAFDEYRMGCFYCPGYSIDGVTGVYNALIDLRRLHSKANWG